MACKRIFVILASSGLFFDRAVSGCIDDIHRYRLLRRPWQATTRSLSGRRRDSSDTRLVSTKADSPFLPEYKHRLLVAQMQLIELPLCGYCIELDARCKRGVTVASGFARLTWGEDLPIVLMESCQFKMMCRRPGSCSRENQRMRSLVTEPLESTTRQPAFETSISKGNVRV